MSTDTHTHTLDCDVRTVVTVANGVTTHSTEFACDTDTEVFEQLLDLEGAVRGARVSVGFAPINLPDHLVAARHQALTKAEAALSAAIDALTPAQMAGYGSFRKAHA